MAVIQAPRGQRLLLSGVEWKTYQRLLRVFDERPGIRLTYDRGALEIRTLTHEHENDNREFAQMVIVLTDELGFPLKQGGSTTFKRRRKRKGIEPDSCFWIANEHRVRGKKRIDLRIDPPPDLGMEVDVSRSSLNRMPIYAALEVPEVWRYDGQALTFHVLQSDGEYAEGPSQVFPGLTAADLMPFFALRDQMDENALMRRFRAWVRQTLAPGGSRHTSP